MTKFINVPGFTRNFSHSDWAKLLTLAGKSSGKVELSSGPATINGKTVFVTIKERFGSRIYEFPASELCGQ